MLIDQLPWGIDCLSRFVIVRRAQHEVICNFYPTSSRSVITQHNACCGDTDLICTDGEQFGPTLLMCERRKHSNSSTLALCLKQHIMFWTISCIIYPSLKEYRCPVWPADVSTKMECGYHIWAFRLSFYELQADARCLPPSLVLIKYSNISDYIIQDVICSFSLRGAVLSTVWRCCRSCK